MASPKRPTNPKPGQTYTGPKGVTWRWSAKQDKWVRQSGPQSWEDKVREQFPAYTYLLDNPEILGQEITDILRKAVQEKWYKNPDNGFAKMDAAIRQTTYFKTTAAAAREFDQLPPSDQQARTDTYQVAVRELLGGQTLPESELNTIARSAARLGLQGPVRDNYIFSQALVRNTEGQFRLGQSAGMILAGGRANELRQTARRYFTSVTDAEVEQFLTGQRTQEDFVNMFKVRAKGQMPHLAEQIDQNLTLEDIASDYRQAAAATLEKKVDDIDMMDPKFMEAMVHTDANGNTRQMTLAEWNRKLKMDRQYGYQYTEAAVSEARRLARSVIRGFGR